MQCLLSGPEGCIRVILHAEFFLCEFGCMQYGSHPEIIFERCQFAEMKMMEQWYVLAEVIHFFMFEAGHVLHLLHHTLQVIFEPESSGLYQPSFKGEHIGPGLQEAVQWHLVMIADGKGFLQAQCFFTPDTPVRTVGTDVEQRGN